jgi:cytochrome c oxidase cbb3-type subunit 3
MAQETNEILGHGAEADGIEEYDNPLPDWWLALFAITIIWAPLYAISYHAIQGNSQVDQYDQAMAAAAVMWPASDETIAFVMTDERVAQGEVVFAQTCATCHAADMTGGAGPSLVDAEWIHGSAPEAVIYTITNGVLPKGMPAWGAMLGAEKVQAVAAYIVSSREPNVVDLAPAEPVAVATGPADDDAEPVEDDRVEGTETIRDTVVDAAVEVLDPLITGESIFAANCTACHMADMTGGVGPNLIDDEWIHAGDLETIRAIVTNGVVEKGMIAWGPILGPAKIELVAQYVHGKTAE